MDVGPDGSVYVADFYNDVIRRVKPDGTMVSSRAARGRRSVAARLQRRRRSGDRGRHPRPKDVEVGPDGSLYIVDTATSRPQGRPQGTITTVAGNGTPTATRRQRAGNQATIHYPQRSRSQPTARCSSRKAAAPSPITSAASGRRHDLDVAGGGNQPPAASTPEPLFAHFTTRSTTSRSRRTAACRSSTVGRDKITPDGLIARSPATGTSVRVRPQGDADRRARSMRRSKRASVAVIRWQRADRRSGNHGVASGRRREVHVIAGAGPRPGSPGTVTASRRWRRAWSPPGDHAGPDGAIYIVRRMRTTCVKHL